MLKVENIYKTYTLKKNREKIRAINGVSLEFGDTGLVSIVGTSGSEKTTLLNILGGIDKPTSGNVFFHGKNLNFYKEADYDNYRNNEISFVFQEYNLLNDYSVLENIKLACRLQGQSKATIELRAKEALESVGLSELAARRINSLSGGQQQRIAIARALAKDSSIILCDEPTGNLDSNTSFEIFELLSKIAKHRLVIIVTHDIELAKQFSNRVIKLSDGKIKDDILLRKYEKEQDNIPNPYIERTARRGRISFGDILAIIKNNFVHSWFGNLFIMLLLIVSISLSTIFMSLTTYNEQDALLNTLKQNGQGVIQIAKYIDYPREEYDPVKDETYIKHGPVIFYERADIADYSDLKKLIGDDANIYKSYFFSKNLQDFTNKFIFTDYTAFQFEARNFREIIAVSDYSTFNMRLKYGHFPQEYNEILIYDYMANSLLFYNVFDCDMSNLVGKSLIDINTGLTMKIAGIIQSDYEIYSYIKNDNNTHSFEETYLTSLQSIFCRIEFVQEIEKEKNYESIFKNYFVDNENGQFIDTSVKKFKNVNLDNISLIATIENYANERGVIVDRKTVANILGVTENQVTAEIAEDFLERYYSSGIGNYYDYSLERNYLSPFSYLILGVTVDNIEDNVLYWYTPHLDDLYKANSTFRQFYVSLGTDWNKNKEILNKFSFKTHNDEFYKENPDYYYEGYTDYIAYGVLIRDANYYLERVQNFAQTIMIIMIGTSVLGMFVFASLTIKTFKFKIGVLKSMGTGNVQIATIFGLQIVLMAVFSYLLSIPISYIMMSSINATFVGNINPNLVFFSIEPLIVVLMLIFSVFSVVIAALIPLLKLCIQTPSAIVRNNKK